MSIYHAHKCVLGEGPMWHPLRAELLWFDILSNTLLSTSRTWSFDHIVSAAGWIDRDQLLIASEIGLSTFHLETGAGELVQPIEQNNPDTRSNDGRIDPWGGFWIGTMGKSAQKGAGAIYRFYKGELRKLFAPITIPNSICFAPDGSYACFSDTVTKVIQRVELDPQGWPKGDPEVYIDLRDAGENPDGAVIDQDGNLWVALWGASKVSSFGSKGQRLFSVPFPASQVSCPAFGGADGKTLYVTSAMEGMSQSARDNEPDAGKIFEASTDVIGQAEHKVVL